MDVSRKLEAYRFYATFMIRAGYAYPEEVLTYRIFCRMWSEEFPHLRLRQKRTVSSKCLVCDDLEVSNWVGSETCLVVIVFGDQLFRPMPFTPS